VRVHQLFYSTLDAYLADQEKLIADGRFDYVLGSLLPQGSDWGLAVEAVEYVTSAPAAERSTLLDGLAFTRTGEQRERAFEDYALRLDAMVESMKRGGTWTSFHPWMDLFISAQSARGLIRAAMEEFEPAELADGYVMTYPLNRSACNTPALGLPSGPQLYLFDVLPNIPTTERSRLSTFEDKCRKVYAKARVADATVYPIGYPVGEMNEGDWRRQFGLNCERLVAAKRLFDPDGILTPGPQVFAKDKAP
jgi:cytokinin dehydrogenase